MHSYAVGLSTESKMTKKKLTSDQRICPHGRRGGGGKAEEMKNQISMMTTGKQTFSSCMWIYWELRIDSIHKWCSWGKWICQRGACCWRNGSRSESIMDAAWYEASSTKYEWIWIITLPPRSEDIDALPATRYKWNVRSVRKTKRKARKKIHQTYYLHKKQFHAALRLLCECVCVIGLGVFGPHYTWMRVSNVLE